MNNNIALCAPQQPCGPPQPLAPLSQHAGMSPQPSSPKGGSASGSKAQPCPHCHREFTNLRHHINQQHMQVSHIITISPALLLQFFCSRLKILNALSVDTAAISRRTWRGTLTMSMTSTGRPVPSAGRNTVILDNMSELCTREPR